MRPLLFFLSLMAASLVHAADLESVSTLDVASAYTVRTGQWQKHEATWRPTVYLRHPSGLRWTMRGLVRVDPEDRLDPGAPEQHFRASWSRKYFPDASSELEIRELYADFYAGEWFWRIGRQQIVWGQSDGLRVLDVVNPLSFREFILPDMEDRRIPLWSAMTEVPVGAWTTQWVWVPDAGVTESSLPSAQFSLLRDPFGGNGKLVVHRPEPGQASDIGMRWSRFISGWDVSLSYLYHTIDDPTIQLDPANRTVNALYNRSHLVGAAGSRATGDFTLRAEIGLESDRRYPDRSFLELHRGRELSYVLGLDYSGIRDTFLSLQWFQTWRERPTGVARRHEDRLTLLARRDFWNDALSLRALVVINLHQADSLTQLDAEYRLSSRWSLRAGIDWFAGQQSTPLGQFRDASRITVGVRMNF